MQLSAKEKELIKNYRKATENRQRIVIKYAQMFAAASQKERGK